MLPHGARGSERLQLLERSRRRRRCVGPRAVAARTRPVYGCVIGPIIVGTGYIGPRTPTPARTPSPSRTPAWAAPATSPARTSTPAPTSATPASTRTTPAAAAAISGLCHLAVRDGVCLMASGASRSRRSARLRRGGHPEERDQNHGHRHDRQFSHSVSPSLPKERILNNPYRSERSVHRQKCTFTSGFV